MKLEEIADVNIGVVLKRKKATYKSTKTNVYKSFNIKCYEENIEYEDFFSTEDLSNYLTKKGDLIFRLSSPCKIILVNEKTENLLINNLYCIIRCKDNMSGEFLKWYLESNMAKQQLEKIAIGSQVKSIPVAKLRLLEIPELDINDQSKIIKIIYNWTKQKELYNKLIEEKNNYYNEIIKKVINRGK